MKRLSPSRPRHGRPELEHVDAVFLRQVGLNPDDFDDAFVGRRSSVLLTPFRDIRRR